MPAARPARRTATVILVLVPRRGPLRGADANGSGGRASTGHVRVLGDELRRSLLGERRRRSPAADGQLGPLYAGKLVEVDAGELARSWRSAAPATATSSAS